LEWTFSFVVSFAIIVETLNHDLQGGFCEMIKSLENRLNDLIHEMTEMKKQIILDKSFKVEAAQNRIREWKALAKRVSAKWNGSSAVEEIRQQREKVW
jgi:hypothetical protein